MHSLHPSTFARFAGSTYFYSTLDLRPRLYALRPLRGLIPYERLLEIRLSFSALLSFGWL